MMIENMRQKESLILKENETLRNYLFGLSRTLPKVFELVDEEDDSMNPERLHKEDHGIYIMPLEMSSEAIVQELDRLMENAAYQVHAFVSALNQVSKVEEAQEKIHRLEHLVTEQTKVIEDYLAVEEQKDITR
jgi:hypothetical protein